MPWGRCDDTHYDHPKVSALPVRIRNQAIGLYWRSISYSNRHLTNGRIPVTVLVSVLDGTPEIAEELRKVRLFDRAGASAFRVHDFDDFNETRQEVLAKREKKAAAGKTGGLRSGAVRRAKRNGSTNEAGASQLVEPPSRPSSSKNPVRSLGSAEAGDPRRATEARSFPTNGKKPPEDEERITRDLEILNDESQPEWKRRAAKDDLDSLGVPVAAAS